ncbi:MAG: tRNA (guanosine(46)-N7)-methyltransferase TrmB [Erysipelotrichales bacterium]|nr:tRNA (guanosine(46)-N7)-methyltransferase TrmB [Erysipelotrichales bacterium]
MRLRNSKTATDLILTSEYLIRETDNLIGNWHKIFNNNAMIHLEIGMGKGNFIRTLAKQHPEINFIGLEKSDKVLGRALKTLETEKLSNLKILMVNAADLNLYFDNQEIARIYLNFSDPWPKIRHTKRRLTNANFLRIYKAVLQRQGEIHLKTDNRKFFEYSIESFSDFGMLIKNINFDLHSSNLSDNIETEYETKLKSRGPIYRLEAYFGGENYENE